MAVSVMRDAQQRRRSEPTRHTGPGNPDDDMLRSRCALFFTTDVAAVAAGQVVGRITASGREPMDVKALRAGHVMLLRRHAPVAPGTRQPLTAKQDAEFTP